MKSSTATISYGILFPKGYVFPWNDGNHVGVREWWLSASGVAGFDKLKLNSEAIAAFIKENPMPFEIINYGINHYDRCILAIPGSVDDSWDGYPTVFNPEDLKIDKSEEAKLIEFCEKYCKAHNFPEMKCKWYLSSCIYS